MQKQTADHMEKQAEIFAELRPALLQLARRILGSAAEAEDMVQEAYPRWAQATVGEVRSPKSFQATIDTRLCLNHLALARVRLEHEDAPLLLENVSSAVRGPAEHAGLADASSEAFTGVPGHLSPTDYPLVQVRAIESGQTLILPTSSWSTNSFVSNAQATNASPRFYTLRTPSPKPSANDSRARLP